jgi:hypothetical protein
MMSQKRGLAKISNARNKKKKKDPEVWEVSDITYTWELGDGLKSKHSYRMEKKKVGKHRKR